MYVCMFVCMYVCMYACMYVCICIYIYTHHRIIPTPCMYGFFKALQLLVYCHHLEILIIALRCTCEATGSATGADGEAPKRKSGWPSDPYAFSDSFPYIWLKHALESLFFRRCLVCLDKRCF